MTTFETIRLFVAIVAIYAILAAIFWYFIDRKIKEINKQLIREADYLYYLLVDTETKITNINSRLRKSK